MIAVQNPLRTPHSALRSFIGIPLGDVTGVGPEVALKAIAAEARQDDTKYLLLGDEASTRSLIHCLKLDLPLEKFSSRNAAGRFFITNPLPQPLPKNLPAGSPSFNGNLDLNARSSRHFHFAQCVYD